MAGHRRLHLGTLNQAMCKDLIQKCEHWDCVQGFNSKAIQAANRVLRFSSIACLLIPWPDTCSLPGWAGLPSSGSRSVGIRPESAYTCPPRLASRFGLPLVDCSTRWGVDSRSLPQAPGPKGAMSPWD